MRLRNKPRPPREAATVGDTDGGAGAGTAGSGRACGGGGAGSGPRGCSGGGLWGREPAPAAATRGSCAGAAASAVDWGQFETGVRGPRLRCPQGKPGEPQKEDVTPRRGWPAGSRGRPPRFPWFPRLVLFAVNSRVSPWHSFPGHVSRPRRAGGNQAAGRRALKPRRADGVAWR